MNRRFSHIIAVVLVIVILNPIALRAQDNADAAAIGKLVEQFFDAYQKEDLDGMMACWSASSSQLADFKQFAQTDFTASDETQFANVTLTRWKFGTDHAFVRLRFDRKWRDAGTKQSNQQNTAWNIVFVKEGENWKFLLQVDSAELFAQMLESAKTKEERAELLKDDKEMVTANALTVLVAKGALLANAGKIDVALRFNEISFEFADALGGADAKGQCYWLRAAIFHYRSEYREALEDYQRALQLFRQAKSSQWEATTLNLIGEIYQLTNRYADALRQHEASIKIYHEINDRAGEAAALGSIGIIYSVTRKNAEALIQFEASLKISREIGDKAGEAKTLGNIGGVYQSTGNYAEALTQHNASLKIAREISNKAREAATLNDIGLVYQSTGKFVDALSQHEVSLKIYREIGDRVGEVRTLDNIGNVYESTGRSAEALSRFEAGLKIAREIGNRAAEAVELGNIGIIYGSTGKYAEATSQFDAGLKISREIGDRKEEAAMLNNMGNVYHLTGQYADSLSQHEASLKISREIGDRAAEVKTLGNIGNVYQSTGKYAEALAQLEAVLKMARELGYRRSEAAILGNIGIIYGLTYKYAEAVSQFEASLKIVHEFGDRVTEASLLGNIGVIHKLTGRYAEALSQFEASLKIAREIGSKAGEAATLSNIGTVYQSTGKYAEALSQYEAGLTIYREIGDRPGEATSLTNIAVTYRSQKQWLQAANSDQKAISLIELIRTQTKEPTLQTGFFARFTSPYYGLIKSLMELGSSRDEIFAVSERAKARTLVELMTSGKINILKSMTDAERQREQELRANFIATSVQLNTAVSVLTPDQRRIDELKQQINDARGDYAEFRVNLFIAHPELQVQRATYDPLALAQLGELLFSKDPDLCLLSYLVGDDKTFLFVITRGKNSDVPVNLNIYTLKTEKNRELTADELRDSLNTFRQRCANESGAYKQIARDLYKLLLAPAKNELKDRRHVVIIPDKILFALPFQALVDEQDKHFIESHTVSYAPSVTALIQMMKLTDKKRTSNANTLPLFAMGRGTFPDQAQYRNLELPKAEEQVKSIARLFGVAALTGNEATKAKAIAGMGAARYVHFATHGELNEVAPMESAIVLGKGPGDDGMLYARELVDMDLQAELVVLSACDTGLGQEVNGEGIVGLTWALFVAGTPTSVVTQWKVRDDSMNRLMLEFYKELRQSSSNGQPPISKAEALRRAELNLMKDENYKHPYHWAPIALVGDWR